MGADSGDAKQLYYEVTLTNFCQRMLVFHSNARRLAAFRHGETNRVSPTPAPRSIPATSIKDTKITRVLRIIFGPVAGAGIEPASQGYEPCEVPLLHPALLVAFSI